jgi:CubicO group peptidase (beta-lactamase class C family)
MYTPADGGGIRPFSRHDFTKKPAFFSGGGGMVSTVGDYFRFAQMLLNGGELEGVRILGHKTVEWMTQDHLGKLTGPPVFPGYGFGLGFGVRREVSPPGTPGSVGQYQWPGASGTAFWVDPREELIGIFMTQLQPGWKRYGDEFEVLAYQAIVD